VIEEPIQLSFASLLFPGRRILYISEVADKLRVSERHVRNLIDSGKIRAVNVGAGDRTFLRIPVEAYEEYLRTQTR
jgi:excisionase family DNA binding protein